MKNISCLLSFLLISFIGLSQVKPVQVQNPHSNINFDMSVVKNDVSFNNLQEWLTSLPSSGEIVKVNSNKGEIIYKGFTLINMSEKPSVFQTEMHYAIHVKNTNSGVQISLKDIYYQSIPEYGKQGTPSVISYPSDWFAKEKMYRKSGKEKWLNKMVQQNTIAKAEELLASANEFIIP